MCLNAKKTILVILINPIALFTITLSANELQRVPALKISTIKFA